MEKILSVSVAAYNVEKYIRQCLTPFADPKYSEILEVLVIDDGATDNTYEIAKEYENRYPSVFKVIHKENGGWGSTVNYGIRHAAGKYFKQLDGDDFFDKDNLDEYLEYLKNVDVDMVYTPFLLIDDNSGSVFRKMAWSELLQEKSYADIDHEIGELRLEMHACTFKTSMLVENKIHMMEHCFYTDVEYMFKSVNCSKTVALLNRTVYCYRVSRDGQSMSVSGVKKHYKEHEKVLMEMLEYTYKYVPEARKNAYLHSLRGMTSLHYLIYFWLDLSKEHRRELISFDNSIKNQYHEVYNGCGRLIEACRRSHFILYPLAVLYQRSRNMKSATYTK
jgi:glycosyltransferase involved in cell wall biosynthesis